MIIFTHYINLGQLELRNIVTVGEGERVKMSIIRHLLLRATVEQGCDRKSVIRHQIKTKTNPIYLI